MLSHLSQDRSKSRLSLKIRNLVVVFATLAGMVQGAITPQTVLASSGSYSLKWYAADPAPNSGPYAPTYPKVIPSLLSCPTPSGVVGRAADPLANAVAYGTFAKNGLDAVTSLAPKNMILGQIVPFEMEINVNGSTAPENGVINFSTQFDTHSTNGTNFGFDPNYMVYCAFVDYKDAGTVNTKTGIAPVAKVDTYTSSLLLPGQTKETIQGNFTVSGLKDGDNVIVEIWVVLKSSVPAGAGGNVQTSLVGASTGAYGGSGSTISTGNQTVPLLQIGSFFTANADVSITKSDSPDPVLLGATLTYQIAVTNNSIDTTANGVVVTDTLDANTLFVSASSTTLGVTCTASSGIVVCNLGGLTQGQVVPITIVTTVKNSAPTSGVPTTETCTYSSGETFLCNSVTVSAITADSNTANNTATASTAVQGTPALSLVKSALPLTYSKVGDVIAYSYVLKNTGNVPLSSPFAVADDKGLTVTCPPTASLAPGASITCTATHNITQSDLDAGSITNKATATAVFNSNTVTSNQATATVTANKSPALTLTKTASPSTYDATLQTITYAYVIENTGNVTLYGPFTVTDDKATVVCTQPVSGALAPLATMNCTATYTIKQTDLDSGSVTNKATASGGGATSNEATATVNADKKPALSLVKTAPPIKYDHVGQLIAYSYLVTNIGNVTLAGPVTVSDDKATVSCPAGGLTPGASMTCTASYTISQADLDAGSVTNTAMAS
ncbi:MAG TPA: DUF11 domain-containing protein, partial [Anaerolineae bacterium]